MRDRVRHETGSIKPTRPLVEERKEPGLSVSVLTHNLERWVSGWII